MATAVQSFVIRRLLAVSIKYCTGIYFSGGSPFNSVLIFQLLFCFRPNSVADPAAIGQKVSHLWFGFTHLSDVFVVLVFDTFRDRIKGRVDDWAKNFVVLLRIPSHTVRG